MSAQPSTSGFTRLRSDLPSLSNNVDTKTLRFPTDLPWVDLTVSEIVSNPNQLELVCNPIIQTKFSKTKLLTLTGFWSQTLLHFGAKIRVFSENVQNAREITISDSENFVLVHPDTLVQCTSVAGAVFCRRKVTLGEKFRGGCDPGNRVMVLGTLVHCLFQSAIQIPPADVTDLWLRKQLRRLIHQDKSMLQQMWALDWRVEALIDESAAYFQHIRQWCLDKNNAGAGSWVKHIDRQNTVRQVQIRDIEENVWCNQFGIRGKIDITLETEHANGLKQLVPVELKTGKSSNSADHQGQVLLYTLMLSSLRDEEPNLQDVVDRAMLVYVKDGSVHHINRTHAAVRGLLQARNELAHYQSDPCASNFNLPEPIDKPHVCNSCEANVICGLWQRAFEPADVNNKSTSPTKRTFTSPTRQRLLRSVTAHLSAEHLGWFKQETIEILTEWKSALTNRSKNADSWLLPAEQREINGDGIASLKVVRVVKLLRPTRYVMIFERNSDISSQTLPLDLFDAGDFVLVSSVTRQHTAMFMGPIQLITETQISVQLDRCPRQAVRSDVYRIDRYQSVSGYQIRLANLLRICAPGDISARIRSLFFDMTPPRFATALPAVLVDCLNYAELTEHELSVAVKVLLTLDFTLCTMPFEYNLDNLLLTLAKNLLLIGCRVLICAGAVARLDSLLQYFIGLQSTKMSMTDDVLYLGSRTRCAFGVCEQLESVESDKQESTLSDMFANARCVLCTTSTVSNHVFFHRRNDFDYVFVLDAHKCTNDMLLAPCFNAERFVFFGAAENENHCRQNLFHQLLQRADCNSVIALD